MRSASSVNPCWADSDAVRVVASDAPYDALAALLQRCGVRAAVVVPFRHAERIVVLGPDGIVEDGSHEELLARDGDYARMFRLQAARFASAGGQVQA